MTRVIFCVFLDEDSRIYQRLLRRHLPTQ